MYQPILLPSLFHPMFNKYDNDHINYDDFSSDNQYQSIINLRLLSIESMPLFIWSSNSQLFIIFTQFDFQFNVQRNNRMGSRRFFLTKSIGKFDSTKLLASYSSFITEIEFYFHDCWWNIRFNCWYSRRTWPSNQSIIDSRIDMVTIQKCPNWKSWISHSIKLNHCWNFKMLNYLLYAYWMFPGINSKIFLMKFDNGNHWRHSISRSINSIVFLDLLLSVSMN